LARRQVRAAWLHRASNNHYSVTAEQLAGSVLQTNQGEIDAESILAAQTVLALNSSFLQIYAHVADEVVVRARTFGSSWWLAQALNAAACARFWHPPYPSSFAAPAHALTAGTPSRWDIDPAGARTAWDEPLQLARVLGDRWLLIAVLISQAMGVPTDDDRSITAIKEAMALCDSVGAFTEKAKALALSAHVATERGEFTNVRVLLEERLAAEQHMGNTPGIVGGLRMLADFAHRTGELDSAEQFLLRSLTYATPGRDLHHFDTLAALGRVYFDRGEYERGLDHTRQALEIARRDADLPEMLSCLWLCGYFCVTRGAYEQAEDYAQELLTLTQKRADGRNRDFYLEIEGMIARYREDLPRARVLLEECITLRISLDDELNTIWATTQLTFTELSVGNLARAAMHLRKCLRYHRRSPFAVDLPLVLEAAAVLYAFHGDIGAARLWGAADALRTQIGAPMWPVDRPEYERRVAEARAQLGPEEWDAAWAAGRALTWEQAADEALAWLEASQPG
jgi:tetratricopeptide (TPR) repeat protein